MVIANKRSVWLERQQILPCPLRKSKRSVSRGSARCWAGVGSSALGSYSISSIGKRCLLKWKLLCTWRMISFFPEIIIFISKSFARHTLHTLSLSFFFLPTRSIRKSDYTLENCREGFGQKEELARAVLEGHYVDIGCCIDGAAWAEKELAALSMRTSS